MKIENCKVGRNPLYSEGYEAGYDSAIRQIRINLEHFKKDVWSISMICEGMDVDEYEGEHDCEMLLRSNILGDNV